MNLMNPGPHRNRRDCLRLGLGALLGGGLVDALRLRAQAAAAGGGPAQSCILIWLDGGPSHFETFDPKPEAPAEIRGEFSTIPTKVPGLYFSKNVTKLAAVADKLAVVRSIRHDQGNHGAGNHYMMTGAPPRIPVGCGSFVSFHPSLGSVTAAERGSKNGLPPYFSIPEMSRSGGPNFLGARYAPFVVPDDPKRRASGSATCRPRPPWGATASSAARGSAPRSTASGGSPTMPRPTPSWRSTNTMSKATT